MNTLRPIRAVSNDWAEVGFKTRFSDSQITLFPIHHFRILTFHLRPVADCIFSKVATALFPGLHCLPEPPSPDQEVESISSSCKPGKAVVTSWTNGMEKNQPPWLLWLGHKRQYRVSLALSWDTHFWNPVAILGGRASYIKTVCRCSSQWSGSCPRFMGEQRSDDPSPQLSSCPSWCWLEQR